MKALYDQIGIDYATQRQSDPRIAAQLWKLLENAKRIVNIGAGSGSYEPHDIELVAVEPSKEMIKQRKANKHLVIKTSAEDLPFKDNSFTHALTILSMHHWADRNKAFTEINRVTTDRFVAVSWNPNASPFWLTRDYFPELYETDQKIFPTLEEFQRHFNDVQITPLLIPEDCIDGFLAAYWKRPEAYLNPKVRQSISTFSKLKQLDTGLKKLEDDLKSGAWKQRNRDILNKSALDAGYILITANVRP